MENFYDFFSSTFFSLKFYWHLHTFVDNNITFVDGVHVFISSPYASY